MKWFHPVVIDDLWQSFAKLKSMAIFSRGQVIFTKWSKGIKGRPPLEAFYIYILALLVGFMIADLSILAVRPSMLPTQPPPVRPNRVAQNNFTSEQQYNKIVDRNVFNADRKIPPALTSDGNGPGTIDAAPVASQLPLKLEGTLVHANPKKSVASIGLKTKNEVQAFMVDSEIENMAKITAIERRKVIIRNLNSNRLEYIEIPKDTAVTFGVKEPQASGEEVAKKSETEFTMRRADISKYTSDLGSILQQARMVPNIIPGSGGRVEGFRFVAIQPGSIYEKLGFKPMDVIKKVNNEDVNSPTKAMELYNALKSENRIQLTIERNGRDEPFTYNIAD